MAHAESHFDTLAKGGAGGWLNVTRSLTTDDMNGRLVLLDFWTYGCVNCIQIIPDLKKIEDKFGDDVLIIGVHSAKFKGEQGNSRILSAAKRFGLEHPVINDSDFSIWKSFDVGAWPTLILLNPDGTKINRYVGEGHLKDIVKDIEKNISKVKKVEGRATIASLIPVEKNQSILSFPARIKKSGNLFYVADAGNDRILAVNQDGKIIKKYDGLHNPRGFDVVGDNIFVADTEQHNLVRINIQTGEQQVVGGDGHRGNMWASPWDILSLKDEGLLIAMAGTHQIVKWNDTQSSVFAGSGRENLKDGKLNEAELAQTSALAMGNDGAIYFVDAESSALRVIKDGQVKTLIGSGLFDFGLKDGNLSDGLLQHPQGLYVADDKIYIADTYNNAIRIYDITSGKLSTLKTVGDTLNEPGAIWVEGDKGWIADTNNHRILNLDLKTDVVSEFKITE